MDEKLRNTFVNNLRRYMDARGLTQSDLMRYMKVSSATASDWTNGKKLPRADRLQSIANWLGVQLSDLVEDKPENDDYYFDPQARDIARDIFANPDLRALMDAARDVRPENLRIVADLIGKLKETNE